MVVLTSLIFIAYNMFCGFSIAFLLKAFLFYPAHKKVIFGKRVPLTPALVYRKKYQLILWLETMIKDYLRDAASTDDETRIAEWEKRAFEKTWDKFENIEKIRVLPHSWKENIRYGISLFVFEITKQFLRSFVPFLMERYKIIKYVDLLDKALDLDVIKEYYNRYVYRIMLYILLGFNFLVGLGNAIIYILIEVI